MELGVPGPIGLQDGAQHSARERTQPLRVVELQQQMVDRHIGHVNNGGGDCASGRQIHGNAQGSIGIR